MLENIRDLLGSNLKRLRKAAGFTQAELAEKADLSILSIQRIEYAERWPEHETIRAIAKALKVKEAELFQTEAHEVSPLLRAVAILATLKDYEIRHAEKILLDLKKGYELAESSGVERPRSSGKATKS